MPRSFPKWFIRHTCIPVFMSNLDLREFFGSVWYSDNGSWSTMHSNLKFYLVLLLPIIIEDTSNCSSARQKFLWHSAFKPQGAKEKSFCQILYSMQMTGPGSSKQTERKSPAHWSTDKSGGFSQLDASLYIVPHSSYCLQSKFPLQSKARIQNTNGNFKMHTIAKISKPKMHKQLAR